MEKKESISCFADNNEEFIVCIRCMTYNQAPYIKDAMNGFCMQQTDFNYVAVIVDDASTDGEPDIIRNYLNKYFLLDEKDGAKKWETEDAHFVFVKHKENKNCHFAVIFLKYNFYLKKSKEPLMSEWTSKAKYIALCEGDDYWTDKLKIQKQVNFLDSHPEYFVCSHNFDILKQDELLIKKNKIIANYNNIDGFIVYTYNLDNYFKLWASSTLTVIHRNIAYSKNIDFSGFKRRWDFIDRYFMMEYGLGALLEDTMAVYRIQQGGIYSGISIEERYDLELDQLYSLYLIRRKKPILHDAIIKRMIGYLSLLRTKGEYTKIFKVLFKYFRRLPVSALVPLISNIYITIKTNNVNNKKL